MKKSQIVVTLEDASIKCGLGSEIESLAFENKINAKVLKIGYPDEFVKHGKCDEIEQKYGIDVDSIVQKIVELQEELAVHRRENACLKIVEKK